MNVISSTALSAFKRCRKQYQLAYEHLLQLKVNPDYMETGSQFHAMAKAYGRFERDLDLQASCNWRELVDWKWSWDTDEFEDAADLWEAYLDFNDFPQGEDILFVDEPLYDKLDDETYMRWTPDLVYRKNNGIVCRDYKTFSKQPTLDMDLDFQGRIYIAALMRRFDTDQVTFEYEYVRQSAPGTTHTKEEIPWTPEECYTRVPLIISRREADVLWEETQWVLKDLKRAKEEGTWYRTDLKGPLHGCSSCHMRYACKAEVQMGYLDSGTIDLTYNRRAPLELPNESISA